MIDKLEFYHGAAIIRLIADERCKSVQKNGFGYIVNGDRSIYVKYTTKARSPWRFTVSEDDVARSDLLGREFDTCILVLVCGGDGICSMKWETARALLGSSPGWLAAKRSFNGCYAVSGPAGVLKKRVAVNQWPGIVFGREDHGEQGFE